MQRGGRGQQGDTLHDVSQNTTFAPPGQNKPPGINNLNLVLSEFSLDRKSHLSFPGTITMTQTETVGSWLRLETVFNVGGCLAVQSEFSSLFCISSVEGLLKPLT